MEQQEPVDWEQEAHLLIQAHRQSYDYEAAKKARSPSAMRRPFETLERAFLMTSQVMVPLLIPRVHPLVPFFSRLLRMNRNYPQKLNRPSLAVLLSGLHAKLLLDTVNFWGFPPFSWVEPRPRPEELLHPLSAHGLELNALSAFSGIALGHILVTARQGLASIIRTLAAQLPARVQAFLHPVAIQVAPVVAFGLHIYVSHSVSPGIVDHLSKLLKQAQFKHQLIMPTLLQLLWGELTRLWARCRGIDHGTVDGTGQIEEWDTGSDDESGVPHDLLCPITGQLFVRPVVLHGMVYEGAAARQWVAATYRHPMLQDISCHLGDFTRALDVEALCWRFAASRGWRLKSPEAEEPLAGLQGYETWWKRPLPEPAEPVEWTHMGTLEPAYRRVLRVPR